MDIMVTCLEDFTTAFSCYLAAGVRKIQVPTKERGFFGTVSLMCTVQNAVLGRFMKTKSVVISFFHMKTML